jgi:hypothetical protein
MYANVPTAIPIIAPTSGKIYIVLAIKLMSVIEDDLDTGTIVRNDITA